jgi:hypothetical protein
MSLDATHLIIRDQLVVEVVQQRCLCLKLGPQLFLLLALLLPYCPAG